MVAIVRVQMQEQNCVKNLPHVSPGHLLWGPKAFLIMFKDWTLNWLVYEKVLGMNWMGRSRLSGMMYFGMFVKIIILWTIGKKNCLTSLICKKVVFFLFTSAPKKGTTGNVMHASCYLNTVYMVHDIIWTNNTIKYF